jgi:hypothetical protein
MVVADEISRIHAQSRGTYGKRRIKAALLAECEMIVNWTSRELANTRSSRVLRG